MKHAVIYVPGLGDTKITGRRLLIAGWRLYGLMPIVHQMNWADKQAFGPKLQALLAHVDQLAGAGYRVSLVGESAGASAALNAYAARPDVIHRVACICSKLKNAETIHPSTYQKNPAFAQSMAMLPASLDALGKARRARVRSVHPLSDPTVPVADTFVDGAQSKTIPTIGHAPSIVMGDTLFSYVLVGFLKQR